MQPCGQLVTMTGTPRLELHEPQHREQTHTRCSMTHLSVNKQARTATLAVVLRGRAQRDRICLFVMPPAVLTQACTCRPLHLVLSWSHLC